MVEHPDIQQRAHTELDMIVGTERWPSAADEQRLPYIRAIIKECERVHPPFLMVTPHKFDKGFVYNGTYIPKDATVVVDIWSLHHDESRYPEPCVLCFGKWSPRSPARTQGLNLTLIDTSEINFLRLNRLKGKIAIIGVLVSG
jgi:cytochrome P450